MAVVTPEEYEQIAISVTAEMLTEWRPGQREAWQLFNGEDPSTGKPFRKKGPVALISGRRVGKTANALRFIICKMLTTPNLACCFVGKTTGEAKQMAFQDQRFGLLRLVPKELIARQDLSNAYVELINGSSLQLYGGRDPNKVRGRGFAIVVFDEPAFYLGGWEVIKNVLIAFDAPKRKSRKDKENNVQHPAEGSRTIIFCTTPQRNMVTKNILNKCKGRLLRIPTSAVLEFLDEAARQEYEEMKDTPFGRREFEALVIWEGDQSIMTEVQVTEAIKSGQQVILQRKAELIAAKAQNIFLPPLWDKTVVSVDHAVGDVEREERSRSGIIAMSRFSVEGSKRSQCFIHADRTRSGRAEDWIPVACELYHEYAADEMIVETNQGGNLIREAIHKYDSSIVIYPVRANKDKPERALFAQQLAAQYRFHFAHHMPELTEELMSFTGKRGPKEPKTDRADAFVQGARRLIRRSEVLGRYFDPEVRNVVDADEPSEEWMRAEEDADTPPTDWGLEEERPIAA